ncbi:MAG: ferrous iron transport protein A [Campylobacter sputorum]|uniref:FeoA family protein n=1 Tax=Campylobacter sputorum TaxID=206 RepID=UPI000B78121E|nr:ferrous iron transport protein A [Campylobacter sputorum]ASM38794.1 ferrous iron transport protein A [Campylobacter sputorum bv. paraureolyticus LMG 11764]MDY6120553.1 ferrous iron transport protein A [Campylobacter sputorum]
MMLNALEDGESAIIESFDAQDDLKRRFFSFGINKGTTIKKIKSTLMGSTIVVELNRSCVILRSDEANKIRIRKI